MVTLAQVAPEVPPRPTGGGDREVQAGGPFPVPGTAAAADVLAELHRGLPEACTARLAYTRWAFRSIPHLACSRMLDVGCGRGSPTLELARLTEGRIVGLDIDGDALAELARRIRERQLTGRVRLVRGRMEAMPFAPHAFDVVWAEGSTWVMGFEAALDGWSRYLVPGGGLVVHEMAWLRPEPPGEIVDYWRTRCPGIQTVPDYLAAAVRHGYDILAWRALPEDVWWSSYYRPLAQRLLEIRPRCANSPDALGVLAQEQQEVELFRKYSKWFGSAFFVMLKPVARWPPPSERRSAQIAGGGGHRGGDRG